MDAKKLSETQIEITETVETPVARKLVYDIDFLQSQRARIVLDAETYAAARAKEVAEIDAILGQAKAQGMRINIALPEETEVK